MQHTITTSADGSTTLQLTEFNESYHSSNGAYTEAMHIYIKNGVEHLFTQLQEKTPPSGLAPFAGPAAEASTVYPAGASTVQSAVYSAEASAEASGGTSACINIFDVGFGTALNCILTWDWQHQRHRKGLPYPRIKYYGIEKYPIQPSEAQKLNYPTIIAQHNNLIPDKTSENPTCNKSEENFPPDKSVEPLLPEISGEPLHPENPGESLRPGNPGEPLPPKNPGESLHQGEDPEIPAPCELDDSYHPSNSTDILTLCELEKIFTSMHSCPWEKDVEISPDFVLHKSCSDIAALQEEYYREAGKSFIKMDPDEEAGTPAVVFYDTFSPATQPELWDEAIFRSIATGCTQGSILVTYCCKGTVKQVLRSCGFTLERLPGPPGKRHILRATLPLSTKYPSNTHSEHQLHKQHPLLSTNCTSNTPF